MVLISRENVISESAEQAGIRWLSIPLLSLLGCEAKLKKECEVFSEPDKAVCVCNCVFMCGVRGFSREVS